MSEGTTAAPAAMAGLFDGVQAAIRQTREAVVALFRDAGRYVDAIALEVRTGACSEDVDDGDSKEVTFTRREVDWLTSLTPETYAAVVRAADAVLRAPPLERRALVLSSAQNVLGMPARARAPEAAISAAAADADAAATAPSDAVSAS